MSEAVGGRVILEAGDAVDIYELDSEHDVVSVRRARIKHIRAKDGQTIWQTPLGVFPEITGDEPEAVSVPMGGSDWHVEPAFDGSILYVTEDRDGETETWIPVEHARAIAKLVGGAL